MIQMQMQFMKNSCINDTAQMMQMEFIKNISFNDTDTV